MNLRPQTRPHPGPRARAKSTARTILLCVAAVPALAEAGPPGAQAPFRVAEGLFDPSTPGLGLETIRGEQVTIWRGAEETHRFSHHPNLVVWGGALHLMWSNGLVHEDSPGQRILHSRSPDGLEWSRPGTLAEDRDGEGICVATGWIAAESELVAFYTVTGGENFHAETALYAMTSRNGREWSERRRITGGFFIESPRPLRDGRLLIGGEHVGEDRRTKRMRLLHTRQPDGLGGWEEARIALEDIDAFVYTEPGFFRRPDGTLVASFRTQTGHLHASESSDDGRTWTNPVSTDFPDATARFYAGNLPDGAAVLINNPLERGDRSLLTIAVSRDGVTFDRAWLVRGEPTGMSHAGRHKLDGWQYPNALVWGDHLLVAYSINKEDVGLTRIPLSALR
jgi:hypothetical protein